MGNPSNLRPLTAEQKAAAIAAILRFSAIVAEAEAKAQAEAKAEAEAEAKAKAKAEAEAQAKAEAKTEARRSKDHAKAMAKIWKAAARLDAQKESKRKRAEQIAGDPIFSESRRISHCEAVSRWRKKIFADPARAEIERAKRRERERALRLCRGATPRPNARFEATGNSRRPKGEK